MKELNGGFHPPGICRLLCLVALSLSASGLALRAEGREPAAPATALNPAEAQAAAALPPALEAAPARRPVPANPAAQPDEPPAGPPLTLPEAISLAFQRQPRLRVYLEGLEQSRGLSDIAFAPFLPTLAGGYSVGGYDLNVGGSPISVKGAPGFAVMPPGFALPFGLNIQTSYELAELRLQWLICDFGRRAGRYKASRLSIDIHQLQTERAFQTVANEVAVAYYGVLRAQALRLTSVEAVRRAEEERDVAQKLARGGVIEREKVLRAEVQLAESRQLLDGAEEGWAVAIAALNLAIGLRCNDAVRVVNPESIPAFGPTLADCLQTAVSQRREFLIARRTVDISQEGSRVARADFAPRVVTEGALLDLQQASPRGHADVALGFIKLEWNLFEGGKRVAERRVADSRVREAMAQADSIADTIAFQVNETYRRMVTARLGIERSRPAVDQARETYRLVRARAVEGDATPSEITDAQTALTRSEQNHLNSVYDYLTAIAKIEYAMGTAPTPATVAACRPRP